MSTEDRSPQGRGPQHTTHYDDCGCQSAALRSRIAELEARVEPTKPATGGSATMDKPTLDAATLDRWAELVDRIRDYADGERPYAEVYDDDLSAFIAQARLALAQAERIATLELEALRAVEMQSAVEGERQRLQERIATLEAELAAAKELADSYRLAMDDSDHRGMGWMAHAATLREALDVWWRVDLADGTDMSSEEYAELWAEAKHKTTVALASTPAASLAAYRKSVLEACVLEMERRGWLRADAMHELTEEGFVSAFAGLEAANG